MKIKETSLFDSTSVAQTQKKKLRFQIHDGILVVKNQNSKMLVWIFQTGEPLHIDEGNPRPMRAMNLSNALVDAGHKVVLWSSAFYYQGKCQRSTTSESD